MTSYVVSTNMPFKPDFKLNQGISDVMEWYNEQENHENMELLWTTLEVKTKRSDTLVKKLGEYMDNHREQYQILPFINDLIGVVQNFNVLATKLTHGMIKSEISPRFMFNVFDAFANDDKFAAQYIQILLDALLAYVVFNRFVLNRTVPQADEDVRIESKFNDAFEKIRKMKKQTKPGVATDAFTKHVAEMLEQGEDEKFNSTDDTFLNNSILQHVIDLGIFIENLLIILTQVQEDTNELVASNAKRALARLDYAVVHGLYKGFVHTFTSMSACSCAFDNNDITCKCACPNGIEEKTENEEDASGVSEEIRVVKLGSIRVGLFNFPSLDKLCKQ